MINKVKTLPALKRIVSRLRRQNKKIVFTNGCFDIIHPGHIKVLKEARNKGDTLIVGLNSDSSVKKIKGRRRPVLNEEARKKILNAIEFVDYIVVFKEKTPWRLIKELKPHFLVKGGDWQEKHIVGKEFVQKVFRVKQEPSYSTSEIIKKVISRYKQDKLVVS